MFFFWPLTFFTFIVTFSVFTVRQNETAGVFERCSFAASCSTPQRRWYDYSWLCCEDGNAWPQAHIVNPFGMALFIGSPVLAIAVPFFWESFEAVLVMTFSSFLGLFDASETQFETAAGSLIGDAQLNGVMGVLLAFSIAELVRWPGILHFAVARRRNTALSYDISTRYMSTAVLLKYLGLTALWGVHFSFHNLRITIDEAASLYFNHGVVMAIVFQTLFLLVLMPAVVRNSDIVGVRLADAYAQIKWWWWLVSVLIELGGLGPHLFANDWYPAWLTWAVLLLFVRLLLYNRSTIIKI